MPKELSKVLPLNMVTMEIKRHHKFGEDKHSNHSDYVWVYSWAIFCFIGSIWIEITDWQSAALLKALGFEWQQLSVPGVIVLALSGSGLDTFCYSSYSALVDLASTSALQQPRLIASLAAVWSSSCGFHCFSGDLCRSPSIATGWC